MTKICIAAVSVVAVLSGCAGWSEPLDPGFAGEWPGISVLSLGAETAPQSFGGGIELILDGENVVTVHGLCDTGPLQTAGGGKVFFWRGEKVCNMGSPEVPVTVTWARVDLEGGQLRAAATGTTPDHVNGGTMRVEFDFTSNPSL